MEKLKADIRSNIEREVKTRSQGRTKASVMDALVEAGKFDVPKALVDNDVQGRVAAAREELKQRGIPNAESVPIPAEAFATESERRVRLGLLVSELVKQAQLQAGNRSAPASKSSPRTTNNPLRLSAITWLTASVVLKSRLSCWKTMSSRTFWKRPRSPTRRCLSIS